MGDVVPAACDVFTSAHRSTRGVPDDVFAQARAVPATPPAPTFPQSQRPLQVTAQAAARPPQLVPSPLHTNFKAAPTRRSTEGCTEPPWRVNVDEPSIRQADVDATTGSLRVDAIHSHAALAVARARGHLTSETRHTSSSSVHNSANETVQRARDVLSRVRESRRQNETDAAAKFDFDGTSGASANLRGLQPALAGCGADVSEVPSSYATPPVVSIPHSQMRPVALNSHACYIEAFSRSGEGRGNDCPISGSAELPNKSLRANHFMPNMSAYQTRVNASQRQVQGVEILPEQSHSSAALQSASIPRPEGTTRMYPAVPSLSRPPSPPVPTDKPVQNLSGSLEQYHNDFDSSFIHGTARETGSPGSRWVAARGAVTASVAFNSMSMPTATEDSSEIDESEEQLFEELADAFTFGEPQGNFQDRGEQSKDVEGGAGITVSTGTHSSVPSLRTDWEGSVWVKYQPLARTTTKPPRWCAVLTTHELKIYDSKTEHVRRTTIPWKTVCVDDLTYAGCTAVSVLLQGSKQKLLQIAATDAQLDAVNSFVRSVRERTPWRGSVLLLQRSQATKASKYCSCEIEVQTVSEPNASYATGAVMLLVYRVDKKTKQTFTMDMGIGERPVISQITTEGVSICLRDGVRLSISAGRAHTTTFWDALSNGLCAQWLRRRAQAGDGRSLVVQKPAVYRVVTEMVAAETHEGDRNGAYYNCGDLVHCLQSAISAQGTRRILTDKGWLPTLGLSLVRDS